jgi:hypothetical protein
MRTLVIAGEYPWPANSGSRLRLLTVLSGLARCGPTELFSIVPRGREDFGAPEGITRLERVGRVGFDDRPASGWGRVTRLSSTSTPFELPTRDQQAVTGALARFIEGHYDLIWYFGVRPWTMVGGLEPAPAILDLVDLEDQKISARLAIPADPGAGPMAGLRRRAARALSLEEVRRWGRLQRQAAGRMVTTVVCSQLDADRAIAGGMPRVSVIPNGYRRVEHTVGRVEVDQPPTVLFQGTLRYPPNAEGARFLVGEIGPRLRARIPGARIRLVGVSTPALAGLDHPPEVTLVGRVPDIDVELAGADLVVVPLRFGSGTRLKILEAFAQRVPVVSTTLGAEGLDVEDGVHLLLGDTADELADACARLLSDQELRSDLVEHAHRLFLTRFQSEVVEQQVALVARRSSPEA